jgi:hypothetical protein
VIRVEILWDGVGASEAAASSILMTLPSAPKPPMTALQQETSIWNQTKLQQWWSVKKRCF